MLKPKCARICREDPLAAQAGAYKMIVWSRQRIGNCDSLFEMPLEAKGVRKTRPRQSFGIIVGVCLWPRIR